MKKTFFITLTILVTTAVGLWFYIDKPKSPPITLEKRSINKVHPIAEQSVIVLNQQKITLDRESKEDDDLYNPYESEVFKAQVQKIADDYQDTARFPVNSQPIRNRADARLPEPYEETEVETPFETEDGDVIGVSAAVDKFQYFRNEIINIRLSLTGVPEGVFVDATATISGPKGDTPLTTNLDAVGANQNLLTGALDTSIIPQELLSKEMIVKVLIDVGGEPFFTTVSVSYSEASAQLTGLGVVQPNGANLEIPFEYNVFIGGYYFISAVLKDQQSGQPLIALQTEGRMSQGNGKLVAKAHIQALKEAGSEGPYILTNIKANRGAERGEQFDIPASTIKQEYAVSGYPFSEYQDETYQDPLSEERVELLKAIGTIESDNNE